MQDWLNARLYHPLAAGLARWLAPTVVTPNCLSVAGAIAIMLAALAYASSVEAWGVMIGVLLHMSWHVLDGADGDLARMTGRSSPQGELIDGICDYAGHIVLYATMGAMASAQIGPLAWVLMLAAGASRVVQQAHYEGARRQYQLSVYGTPWMASAAPPRNSKARSHPFVVYYLWLTGLIIPHGAELLAVTQDAERVEKVRVAMQARAHMWLPWISPLSSNYRTLAIGAAMLIGKTHLYFLAEIFILGAVFWGSMRRLRRIFGEVLGQSPPRTLR